LETVRRKTGSKSLPHFKEVLNCNDILNLCGSGSPMGEQYKLESAVRVVEPVYGLITLPKRKTNVTLWKSGDRR